MSNAEESSSPNGNAGYALLKRKVSDLAGGAPVDGILQIQLQDHSELWRLCTPLPHQAADVEVCVQNGLSVTAPHMALELHNGSCSVARGRASSGLAAGSLFTVPPPSHVRILRRFASL